MRGRKHIWVASVLTMISLGALGLVTRATWSLHSPRRAVDQARLGEFKAGPTRTAKPQVVQAYGKLPLTFEANQGQTDAEVKFVSRGNGYILFLTPTEAVLALYRVPATATEVRKADIVRARTEPDADAASVPAVVCTRLVGANPAPHVVGLDEVPGKSNYFLGSEPKKWRTNVPHYARVKYHDVYPGVDLIYHGTQRQLEYDFVVAPGADPNMITLSFSGMDNLELDADGDLVLQTPGGPIRQQKPVIFQEKDSIRQEISGGYVLKGEQQVGFQLGPYDPLKPLVIDPTLVYSTYLGGNSDDFAFSIAVGKHGSAYITGRTFSTNFPTRDPLQPALTGVNAAFVTKLSPDGSGLVYSTYLGGSRAAIGFGIAVDKHGNAYVAGATNSADFPTVNPFQADFHGGPPGAEADAFLAKLSRDGSELLYSTYLGGNEQDIGEAIAVDSKGKAYITGFTRSPNFPTSPSAFQTAIGGGTCGDPPNTFPCPDVFVAKIDTNQSGADSLVYSTYLGGRDEDVPSAIAFDDDGKAYVTGETLSPNFPTQHPFQPNLRGPQNAFVAKLNEDGSALLYSTYLGGNGEDTGFGIALDDARNIIVAGCANSRNFPTMNALQPMHAGGPFDAFVAKFNPAGDELIFSTYLGGSGLDIAFFMALDDDGNIYLVGDTNSPNFPIENPLQRNFGGGARDAFVAKLTSDGSALEFSTYLGGSRTDQGFGIAVDRRGNAYVTGQTRSDDFPTMNPFQPARGGGMCGPLPCADAYVAKIAVGNDED